ncbi:LURP-one-related/scramblase family protein [Liberiplasma polymorphum]|uniref:LURP-one-related/scramblase family protein n=1 Tax=Liberiplasma polymorphum TaxID=3374570 RepID=UPI0037708BE4
MKFYIKPNHFAQYRSFKIRDESQGELFKIKGKFFLGLRRLTIKDMNGEMLYTVKRICTLNFYRTYIVKNELNEEVARISRTFARNKPLYMVTMKDYIIHFEGDIHSHSFSLHDEKEKLVEIKKGEFPFGEAFEINVTTERKTLLHLFLVVAIDQMNHERKKYKSAA